MRKGLILLATAATLGTAAIASPASAQYYGGGYHQGWDRGDHWDHRDGDWRRDEWRRERAREWRRHHRDDGYYRSGYDRGYYGGGYYGG
jgi:hypothetical protein